MLQNTCAFAINYCRIGEQSQLRDYQADVQTKEALLGSSVARNSVLKILLGRHFDMS